MTEQPSGLRFDIYERVHVSDHHAGIRELDELELVPHIRVHVEEEQAVVQGNLWLTGKYAGEADGAQQTLEHLIPVEITMPLSRIEKLEDVQVDIEQFDVDLLSARSLNVTGVLSLRGIEMRSNEPSGEPLEAEEEVVFVHEAGRREEPRGEERRIFPEEVGLPGTEPEGLPLDHEATADAAEPFTGNPLGGPQEGVAEEQPVAAEPVSESDPDAAASEPVAEEPEAVPAQAAPAAEKQETKLNFGSKKPAAAEPTTGQPFSLKSLLGGPRETRADDAAKAGSEAAYEPAASGSSADAVEWQKLFLPREDDTAGGSRDFRRMRVCIVQKEETLDAIAQRYKLNPREIALHNRLADQEVAEGQVLYIPS